MLSLSMSATVPHRLSAAQFQYVRPIGKQVDMTILYDVESLPVQEPWWVRRLVRATPPHWGSQLGCSNASRTLKTSGILSLQATIFPVLHLLTICMDFCLTEKQDLLVYCNSRDGHAIPQLFTTADRKPMSRQKLQTPPGRSCVYSLATSEEENAMATLFLNVT